MHDSNCFEQSLFPPPEWLAEWQPFFFLELVGVAW